MISTIAEAALRRVGRQEIQAEIAGIAEERLPEKIDAGGLLQGRGIVHVAVDVVGPVADSLRPAARVAAEARSGGEVGAQGIVEPLFGVGKIAQERESGIAEEGDCAAGVV